MIIDKLRLAADCVPLWASIMNAAADEIERLQKREDHLVNVGSVDKIKADAVREARIACAQSSPFEPYGMTAIVMGKDLMEHADKLERGEK